MNEDKLNLIKEKIFTVKDFPRKGIAFKDITPIFKEPELVKNIIDLFVEKIKDIEYDIIVGPESRGFLFGIALSLAVNKPFVPIRKVGKLPREVISIDYGSEYGKSTIEIHKDDIKENDKILIIDDLLATGGTIFAIETLIKSVGAIPVANLYLIELVGLQSKKLESKKISLIKYEKPYF
jgi:adenine phosphoribosyltransferase